MPSLTTSCLVAADVRSATRRCAILSLSPLRRMDERPAINACALVVWKVNEHFHGELSSGWDAQPSNTSRGRKLLSSSAGMNPKWRSRLRARPRANTANLLPRSHSQPDRSEERRVGKEG